MGEERRSWEQRDASTDATLLVLDHDSFVVPDLITGAAYLIDPSELDAVLDAGGSTSSLPRVDRRAVGLVPEGHLALVSPTLLRIDGSEVLAWDPAQRSNVPLERAHLQAVSELHEQRRDSGDHRSAGVSTASPQVRADLVALGLAVQEGAEAVGSRVSNGPNASASATHEVMVELSRRVVDPPVATPDPGDEEPVASTAGVHAAPRSPISPWRRLRRRVGRLLRLAFRYLRQAARSGRRGLRAALGRGRVPASVADVTPVADTAFVADIPLAEATSPDPPPVEPEPADAIGGVGESLGLHHDGSTNGTEDSSGPRSAEAGSAAPLGVGGRIPVIPLYSWGTVSQDCGQVADEVEPVLSIGMIMAHARSCRDGALSEIFDFVRIRPDSTEVLAEWSLDPRPAVFLFSDYLWNLDQHLEWSAVVKELSPESLCIHGGPSCPKYDADARAFVTENPGVDIAVRGEGELVFEQLLVALGDSIDPLRLDRLADVPSLTYVDHSSGTPTVIRTADAPRPDDLDAFPSPYLSGEFDDLLSVPWRSAAIETNRGCPYGCTFCDWGSATLARIRKFDLDRVKAELDWVMENATPPDIMVTDANFGIFARDLEVAEHLAALRAEHHLPYTITISGMAKNTVKHSVPIIQTLVRAGIGPIAAQSVQSTDEATLSAIRRTNIKLERFDDMARAFQELGLPLVTDILIGLPGSTVESFKNDLQDCLDREVTARTMEILLLPNSPMNDPEYREEWQIEADEYGVVSASSSFSRADYEQMKRLRLLYRSLDHFGLLRHVLRHLQWEHGHRALDVMHDIDRAIIADPNRYPLLGFVGRLFDIYTVPPIAWEPFFDEVVDFLENTYRLTVDSALDTVLSVQKCILPARGRTFPETVELRHDYVAYRQDRAVAPADVAPPMLADYGPGTLTVDDPNGVCERYIQRNEMPDRRDHTTSNLFWVGYDWELASPLMRHLVTNVTKNDLVA